MPIPTESESNPGVSLLEVGDAFKWALVDVNPYDVRKFGSEELTGKTGYVLTVLVVDPGQAVTGNQEDGYTPVNAGDVVSIYVSSYGKWDPDRDPTTAPYMSWGGATKPFGKVGAAGNVDEWVGLIGEWKYLEQLKPSSPGISGRKDRKFRLRKPTADEADTVAKCRQILDGDITPAADDFENDPF